MLNYRELRQAVKEIKAKEDRGLKIAWVLMWLVLAALLSLLFIPCAHAAIDDQKAVLSIIGEAENQGPKGMLAVACAIRNRGTLKGVFGLNAPRVKRSLYNAATLKAARNAWNMSKIKDITGGADHWENVTAFGRPYWAASMTKTITIGSHNFYRSK